MTMAAEYHRPVMAEVVVAWLVTNRDGKYIDATAGSGAHALHIASRLGPAGHLWALDRDDDAVAAAGRTLHTVTPHVEVVKQEFGGLMEWAVRAGISGVHGIFFDLGVSSHQLDTAERGFSYRQEGPLDLRMDQQGGRTAADLINTATAERLAQVLYEYGEERNSRAIARAIVSARQRRPIGTTRDVTEIIASVTNPRFLNKTLSRVFQALRIEVNDELEQLRRGLTAAIDLLCTGGRVVVISYHSLEDRLVKQMLRAAAREESPRLRLLTPKPVVPSAGEVADNPRARSAKLRAAEKC
ncbi:MAG: 16S rRNA (cytosine(1402)-N(4))-methyltransferase RsmH [candidate division Zixibacteria bacterium]|nr:16S rRNA (cytosine(1402)-N(4))-methyltransferase RsmH [candidate division Zixibacteria bacterium]